MSESAGVSTVGRRLGQQAAKVALQPAPALSRISEGSHESASVPGGMTEDVTIEKIRDVVTRTMASKFAVAALVFIITALLLIITNPPMAQSLDNPTGSNGRSVQKILVWSSLAAVTAFMLPYCIRLVKKSN